MEQVHVQEEDTKMADFEQCMESVGMKNRYQQSMLLIFAPYWIIASFFLFQQLYTFQQPQYLCVDTSLTQSQCRSFICDSTHDFEISRDVAFENTFTYKFELFCDKEYIRIIYKLFPDVLAIIGYLIYGVIGDYKGRMVACKISWRFFIVGCLFFALSETQVLITFGYIMASINCFPTLLLQFPILFEQSNDQFRSKGSLVILASYGVGQFILSAGAKPVIDRLGSDMLILLFCAIPAFICNLFLSRIIQSARYVYGKSKIKALNVLNKIAQRNKRQRVIIDLSKSYWIQNYKNDRNITYFQAFYYPTLKLKMLVGLAMFYSTKLTMTTSQVLLDDFLSPYYRGAVISVTTSLSNLVLCFYIIKINRSITKHLVLLSLSMFLLLVINYFVGINESALPIIFFSVIFRAISSTAYGIMLIWGVQTFPTVFRVMGYSFVMVGAGLAPIIPYALRGLQIYQICAAFLITLISIPVSLKMPNTLGKKLQDQVTEETFWKQDKFYRY